MTITILQGDARAILPTLPDQSVQAIVTSPPYWRMRQYTDDPREIGREDTPSAYVGALADVFALCWRVLRDDGTLWINIGDCYANDGKWGGSTGGKHADGLHGQAGPGRRRVTTGLPPKSLIGLPWRLAFALQDQGWVLRSEIIWWKKNAFPEGKSAIDRFSRDHEQVFFFSKCGRYYSNPAALAEPVKVGSRGSSFTRGKTAAAKDALAPVSRRERVEPTMRHPRTVWSIPTQGLPDEHYAPMPEELARRCILAGSRAGDTILDLFAGSGTTLRAAEALGRSATGIDLAYQELQERRTDGVQRVCVELWQ